MAEKRYAQVHRKTNETDISLTLTLDGNGKQDIATGIGFFDHMLSGFTRHGFFDLDLNVAGDLGDKKGIKRFGSMILPMDETLVLCAIDLSGRPYFAFDAEFTTDRVGDMDTEMVREFFYAISYSAAMNLHLKLMHGSNNHHIMEAAFKAFAKALDEACSYDPRITDVLSTKGAL